MTISMSFDDLGWVESSRADQNMMPSNLLTVRELVETNATSASGLNDAL